MANLSMVALAVNAEIRVAQRLREIADYMAKDKDREWPSTSPTGSLSEQGRKLKMISLMGVRDLRPFVSVVELD